MALAITTSYLGAMPSSGTPLKARAMRWRSAAAFAV